MRDLFVMLFRGEIAGFQLTEQGDGIIPFRARSRKSRPRTNGSESDGAITRTEPEMAAVAEEPNAYGRCHWRHPIGVTVVPSAGLLRAQ